LVSELQMVTGEGNEDELALLVHFSQPQPILVRPKPYISTDVRNVCLFGIMASNANPRWKSIGNMHKCRQPQEIFLGAERKRRLLVTPLCTAVFPAGGPSPCPTLACTIRTTAAHRGAHVTRPIRAKVRRISTKRSSDA
jgi:hypothetical protein